MPIIEIHTHRCNDNDKLHYVNDGLAVLGRLGHCVAVFVCLSSTQTHDERIQATARCGVAYKITFVSRCEPQRRMLIPGANV